MRGLFAGLPYYGGKQTKMDWLGDILDFGAPTGTYIEPFFGGGSVLFARFPAIVELANDADGQVINFWRQIKTNAKAVREHCDNILYHPAEHEAAVAAYHKGETGAKAAAYFMFNCYASYSNMINATYRVNRRNNMATRLRKKSDVLPTVADRLRAIQFESRPINEYLRMFKEGLDKMRAPVLMYVDPPYLNAQAKYHETMSLDDHTEMCEILRELAKGRGWHIAVSNYTNDIYDAAFADWQRYAVGVMATASGQEHTAREEVVWRSWR